MSEIQINPLKEENKNSEYYYKVLLYNLLSEIKSEIFEAKTNITKNEYTENINQTTIPKLITSISDSIKILISEKIEIAKHEKKNENDEKECTFNIEEKFKYENLFKKLEKYREMENELKEMKSKLKYKDDQVLNKDKKDQEILLLRSENSKLKNIINENNKKINILNEEIKNLKIKIFNKSQNYFNESTKINISKTIKDSLNIILSKVFDIFGSNYSIINYINMDIYKVNPFDKLLDKYYKKIEEIKITNKYLYDEEMNQHMFNYKIITYDYYEYKICRFNFWGKIYTNQDFPENININPKIIENVRTTNEIEIYNFLPEETKFIYFILKIVFERYSKSVTKLKIYLIGLKTLDDSLFTVLASYLIHSKNIDTLILYKKYKRNFPHLNQLLTWEEIEEERNEETNYEIPNFENILYLYNVLITKTNLIELRLVIFLDHYNFCLLGLVLENNIHLKILDIINTSNKEEYKNLNNSFNEKNDIIGNNILDEIFIFFNYLFSEENLTELALKNFNFISDINFMAVQAVKTMKNLDKLNLDSNIGLVNGDNEIIKSYNLSSLTITQLNMGMTYFINIKKWFSLIHPLKLQYLDAGKCDFTSFTSLCNYLENCHCKKVIIRLDKPVAFKKVPGLFDIISGAPMKSKYLQYFYVLNALNEGIKEKDKYKDIYLPKLFLSLKHNNVLRKLSFSKPGIYFYEIKNDEDFEFHTFKYIKEKDYNNVLFMIKAMKKLFKHYKGKTEGEVDNIIKSIIMYRFSTYRKLITI